MTFDSGAVIHHSARGAYFLTIQVGITRATSQKNGQMAATIT